MTVMTGEITVSIKKNSLFLLTGEITVYNSIRRIVIFCDIALKLMNFIMFVILGNF